MFPTCSDSENEKSKSVEYSENVGDKTVDLPQPGGFRGTVHELLLKGGCSQIQLALSASLCYAYN